MARSAFNRDELKEALKEALAETLNDNREVFHEIFSEVLEEFVHTQIVRDGDRPKPLHRNDVFPRVEGKA